MPSHDTHRGSLVGRNCSVYVTTKFLRAPYPGSEGHTLARRGFPPPPSFSGAHSSQPPALLPRRRLQGKAGVPRSCFTWTTLMGNSKKNVQESWGAVITCTGREDWCPGPGCEHTHELSFSANINWRGKACVKKAESGFGCDPHGTWGRRPSLKFS